MKKNWTIRVASIALTLTLISTCFVGGTFAKYTSSTVGNGNAVVAAWKIKAGNVEGGSSLTNFTLEETSNANIASGKIAPGADGSLPVYIDLTGTEVSTNVQYFIKVNDMSKLPTNFKMKLASGVPVNFTANDTYVLLDSTTINLDGKAALDETNGKWNTTVMWEWPFETINNNGSGSDIGDADDTADAIKAASAVFTLKVVATQVA